MTDQVNQVISYQKDKALQNQNLRHSNNMLAINEPVRRSEKVPVIHSQVFYGDKENQNELLKNKKKEEFHGRPPLGNIDVNGNLGLPRRFA